jgi:hypothetical protein
MRTHRRLGLIGRVIPFLATGVALIALIVAALVEIETNSRVDTLATSIAAVRAGFEDLGNRVDQAKAPELGDAATQELATLRAQVAALEAKLTALAATPPPPAAGAAEPVVGEAAPVAVDPNLPTTDCIPIGTRFMATPDTTYPLCQSPVVVKVGMITGDSASIIGAGEIAETSFALIAGTKCTVMVFSADSEGFAELRVSCT